MIKRRASGWHFWGVVVAVAFRGPYGPEAGYDPRDKNLDGDQTLLVSGESIMGTQTCTKRALKIISYILVI